MLDLHEQCLLARLVWCGGGGGLRKGRKLPTSHRWTVEELKKIVIAHTKILILHYM